MIYKRHKFEYSSYFICRINKKFENKNNNFKIDSVKLLKDYFSNLKIIFPKLKTHFQKITQYFQRSYE